MNFDGLLFHFWNMVFFDDFDGLALFVRVIEAGGLAAAERATSIPKATLSRRLSALERKLNVRLVRRTRAGTALTDAGRDLYTRSRIALSLAEEALAELQSDPTILSGRLRISVPPDIAALLIAPALVDFQARNPDVNIEMLLSERNVSLFEEGYDLAIRMGPLVDSDLKFQRLARFPRALVASRSFIKKYGKIADPSELLSLPAVAISHAPVSWTFRSSDGRSAAVSPRIVFSANRQSVLAQAAMAGIGVANLPTIFVTKAIAEGFLAPILPDWQTDPIEMTALWRQDHLARRLVKAVISHLSSALSAAEFDYEEI